MIIVAGMGRSGTSLVAQLYKELGFDPGGGWVPKARAGLEAREIVNINRQIEKYVGIGLLGERQRPTSDIVRSSLRRIRKRRRPWRPRLDAPAVWSRFESAVERYGARLRELASAHDVVKDPRFSVTLRVWAEAGAEVEHVLVPVRTLDEVSRSVIAADKHGRASENAVRNALVYRFGLCMTTLYDYRIDHSIVRFPDFVEQPNILFEAMRFPRSVSHEDFTAAFNRVVQPDMVTELRASSERGSRDDTSREV